MLTERTCTLLFCSATKLASASRGGCPASSPACAADGRRSRLCSRVVLTQCAHKISHLFPSYSSNQPGRPPAERPLRARRTHVPTGRCKQAIRSVSHSQCAKSLLPALPHPQMTAAESGIKTIAGVVLSSISTEEANVRARAPGGEVRGPPTAVDLLVRAIRPFRGASPFA